MALATLALVVAFAVVYPRAHPLGLRFFIQILIFGIANGAIYALIALGYTMVFGIIELINFAHGDIFTLGALVSYFLVVGTGVLDGQHFSLGILVKLGLTSLLVMPLIGFVNVAIERIAYRPLRYAPRLAPLLTALGMSFVLEGAMYMVIGPFNLRYPDVLPTSKIPILGVSIGVKDLIVIALALILIVSLTVFVNNFRLGRAMRATAQDPQAAMLMGISIDRTVAATFFIGAFLAAGAGIIYGLYYNDIYFNLGFSAGLIAFTAAVLGGIGNIPGAALGGLIIGIIRTISDVYFLSTWTDVVIFAILILVLVFRPSGLLGMRLPEKS